MPTRTARTTWTGGLQDGTGTVALVSSGVGTYEVSFPRRAADDAGGVTSPEELIAAAHTACFAMQFSALLGEAGGSGQSLDVRADVTLGPDPAGAVCFRNLFAHGMKYFQFGPSVCPPSCWRHASWPSSRLTFTAGIFSFV